MQTKSAFYVAGFAIDGEHLGTERWEMQKLSKKWLDICGDFLARHGDSFDKDWGGNLSHVRTQFTAASGAALVTFYARGNTVASLDLASGLSTDTDSSLLKMFVNSLRQVKLVALAAKRPDPFETLFTLTERPLMAVVPWSFPQISEEDHEVVRDLALHLAGAFFQRVSLGDLA